MFYEKRVIEKVSQFPVNLKEVGRAGVKEQSEDKKRKKSGMVVGREKWKGSVGWRTGKVERRRESIGGGGC